MFSNMDELEDVMLTEICKAKKSNYCMIPLIGDL